MTAGGERAGDAACLPAELEVVQDQPDAVGVGDGDVEDANDQARPEDAGGGAEAGSRVGEEASEAGEHAGFDCSGESVQPTSRTRA